MSQMSTSDQKPAPGDVELIERAIAAVGAHQPGDYELDLDTHATHLKPEASALRTVLESDPIVRQTLAAYRVHDAEAVQARHGFEFAIAAISIVVIAATMLALFLIAVPPAVEWPVRAGLSIIAGTAIVTLLSNFRAAIDFKKRHGWMVWVVRLTLAAVIALAFWHWIVPLDFTPVIKPIQNCLTALFLACAVAADAVSGGVTARLFAWVPGFRGRPLHRAWYDARGKAEANRRHLFMAVLNSEPTSGAQATTNDVPLLSQKLEYFRRYQIEVQQDYYAGKSKDNKGGARRAAWARVAAFVAFVLMFMVMLVTLLAKLSEQGAQWLPDTMTIALLEFAQRGWDDFAVLAALFFLGTYVYLQLKSVLLRESINHRRFGNALGQLRQATSPTPGQAELKVPSPLADARKAAVEGNRTRVEQFLRDTNRLLASEVGDWNAMTPYTIVAIGNPPATRLFSADRLSSEDFDLIVRDLVGYGGTSVRARKISYVAARQAQSVEEVETRIDGKESHNTAQPGDWIVTNMDPERAIIRDKHSNSANTYVILSSRFPELYARDVGAIPPFGDVYKAKGVVDAVSLPGGFDIVAPWGERQQGARGYLLRNGADVYGIHADAFDKTYEVVPR